MKWVLVVDYAENAGGVETFGPFTSHPAAVRAWRAAEARFAATPEFRDVQTFVAPLRPVRALGAV